MMPWSEEAGATDIARLRPTRIAVKAPAAREGDDEGHSADQESASAPAPIKRERTAGFSQ